ncbi:MAG: twitching motility protein PilT [Firmicutes bacterium]|nr:twitching motility protein PilT [Bacillota bacterium]
MIQLVIGKQGAGKTKTLVEMANTLAKTNDGHIVYVDADQSQIFRLDYSIRLVQTAEYPLKTSSEFFGFVCGILSQDYDINTVFIDGLLKNARMIDPAKTGELLDRVAEVADRYNIHFIISMSCDENEIPEHYRSCLI